MSNDDNPLLRSPFFSIPGVDPNAPISAQMERIDQLNTLLLQDIDANFARFHQIITSKVLPQIKRYAISSEPTRESALPDASTQYDDQTLTLRQAADESSIRNDDSFMFNPPPGTSSTPLPAGRGAGGRPNDSWEDSMESPFDRLDRKLMDELKIGKEGYEEQSSSEMPTPSLPSGYSLPGLDSRDSSRISSIHDYSVGTIDPSRESEPSSSFGQSGSRPAQTYHLSPTPKANRLADPPPASSNPFGADFEGIVDMRDTPLNAKKKNKDNFKPKTASIPSLDDDSDSDESNDGFGMSPPVTMKFDLPPRAQAIMNAARTPGKGKGKEAEDAGAGIADKEREAKFILDDLLEEMSNEMSPRMETPEALRRYSVLPGDAAPSKLFFSSSSLSPAIAEDEDRTFIAASLSHPSHPSHARMEDRAEETYHPDSRPAASRQSLANSSFNSNTTEVPNAQMVYSHEEDSFDDEGDTFDSSGEISSLHVPSTGSSTHPGFGPLPLSSQPSHPTMADQSYLSSEGDLTRITQASNTSLFGGGAHGGRLGVGAGGRFALMTKEDMDTYHGGRLEDAAGEDVWFSPTRDLARGRNAGP
ncbi:hypothetical protein I307_03870 [Cryptococcus deuterogattii 99/473]|uniref:DASH complex subunit ASK1 n=1 Tax=Cryptococcus deuterogattii Ram5 TaxID=1296110 RepID=A0A0D0SXH6_9TREE|nr:hypothetical protein I309_02707 [Cryptococcus deuterogattii LA55]KIR37882.1 hypothetical protein I313_06252 [Cryptococcus deuterogattii Ram5]KIR93888.1 hypothetical protein I304_02573 [Cryptococcus deuterogattii CBS 10090]KIY56762.1 hypothetical protein I307_03870 [Cryptococcus deuterogattii 99/473]